MIAERLDLSPYMGLLPSINTYRAVGQVTELVGLLVESAGPAVAVGDLCEVRTSTSQSIRLQCVGFRDGKVLSMPLDEVQGLQLGDPVIARPESATVSVGPHLLGRVLDGFGRPMDEQPWHEGTERYPLQSKLAGPLEREPIKDRLVTGIRAIDCLLPCGRGQRVGIFGGSGVGKSTLLGAMARNHTADVTVIGLIGERNREVRGFLEHDLGPEGRKRAVVVCATSDRPAPLRIRASFVSLAIAEYFRDQGANVMLIMDSVTRLAMAQREIGLAAGEPPSQKGYPPSVFNLLPQILERPGNFRKGSITALFTVLVEGDDFNEPICDAVRGILDGHIILSRQLGAAGHYPAIDILQSISRLASQLATRDEKQAAQKIREALAAYQRAEDLINLGAYAAGSNPQLDAVIRARPQLLSFLRQGAEQTSPWQESAVQLQSLATQL